MGMIATIALLATSSASGQIAPANWRHTGEEDPGRRQDGLPPRCASSRLHYFAKA